MACIGGSEHDSAAAKTTNLDVVGDAIEIKSANRLTLIVENKHIIPPEEPELIANTDSHTPKSLHKSIKSRSNSPVASTSRDVAIRCPACEEEYCDHPTEEWIQCCKCKEWWHEE
ncbi:uncharacterized protein TNCV_4401561 [Trichonephila clavipes]|nr:uncharacterized protein TNCV_4401561 [Trichonephila clavipes]